MLALVVVLVFFVGLVAGCVALLRSSSTQRRLREGPRDLRRADDAERAEPYDPKKAARAAQDASNWGSPGW
jgi:hypothetical protein